ncbi:MAG TPA: hypothetical protein PLC22_18780 [Gordonia sp. (in: high G+C Gram-positive bacteria)]|nr:hypothetical protein [Gordonia sp. (in: high G+C Gram-positive bacteria)]
MTELESSVVVAADDDESREALAPAKNVATTSCDATGLRVIAFQFRTSQLAADYLSTTLRDAPAPDEPTSQTVDVSGLPGAKMVMNPEYGSAGIYWVTEPNVQVSVLIFYDDTKVDASEAVSMLTDAAVFVDQRVR